MKSATAQSKRNARFTVAATRVPGPSGMEAGYEREAIGVKAKKKQRRATAVLGRFWLPLVFVVVGAIAAYGVVTVRQASEDISNPPDKTSIPHTVVQINPKHVTYEVFGVLGGSGRVIYANLDSEPVEVTLTSLPWSHSATTMSPSASLSLVTQVDGDSVGCRIMVDGEVRAEHFVEHESAAAACTVTAA